MNGHIELRNNQFTGKIVTYNYVISFFLKTNDKAAFSTKAPKWVVMGKSPAGHYAPIGAAWEHDIKRGRAMGSTMFQIVIDDPAFGADAIYFNAYPNTSGEWEISIDRKKRDEKTAAASDEGEGVPFEQPMVAAV